MPGRLPCSDGRFLRWPGCRLGDRPAARVLDVIGRLPLILVLDGLEVVQEGPAGTEYGRLLGGLLREVLTGLCRLPHRSLAVLTSRFVFADLEIFDGSAARMMDVPALTVNEGADLLERAGGGWLAANLRRQLVGAVDGHALAVGALGGALEGRPPTADLVALAGDLERTARTNDRVQRVLAFYANRLAEEDVALVAIVALFQRPVSAQVVITLRSYARFGAVLASWSIADAQAAAQQRLSGLLSWHGTADLSAHPLVRDAFRPRVLTAYSARLVSELELADVPDGELRTREQARHLVEIIELLLDAGEWNDADELYRARAGNGGIWWSLPAAAIGERAALAFVATAERQVACKQRLSERRLGNYLNEVGVLAAEAGDVATAQRFHRTSVEHARATEDRTNLAIHLLNWASLLAWQGHVGLSRSAAEEALALARSVHDDVRARSAQGYLGWALHLSGLTTAADLCFLEAASGHVRPGVPAGRLRGGLAALWGRLLLDTGRLGAARRCAEANLSPLARRHEHQAELVLNERLLARCDVAQGRPDDAVPRLRAVAETFRDGNYVLELADTLVDLAELRRTRDDLRDAEQLCAEAIQMASPRELVPTLACALARRARVRADRRTDNDRVRARDDADHALRLATRVQQLPWQELDALRAHAHLDVVAGTDEGWAEQVETLSARLTPDSLDPDPIATLEAGADDTPRGQADAQNPP